MTALHGRGCVVAGRAGVGKSRLATDAAGALGRERTLVRVVATAAAGKIPFGAVSHLLPGSSTPAIGDFVAALRDGQLGRSPILLVDDAHLLDDASAALLLAIANTGVAPLLLTVRSNEPAPDALVVLWKDRHVERVDLQPLSEREVEQLIDDLLGAPSHSLAYERIYRLSAGNPLYVTELVADVRRTGRLELRDGRWHLSAGRAPFERLSDLLASHIGSVSAGGRAALEVLAVGAPMPLAVFDALASAEDLEELERARLAVVSDDARGPFVEVAHPLYGEVVLGGLPVAAARRIRRDLAAALARLGTDSPTERLAIARLLLESGQLDEERFLEASSIALRLGAPELAGDLAAALPPSLSAALCVSLARAGVGRFGEVEPLLSPFEEEAAAANREVATAYVETRVRSLLRAGEAGAVETLIARCERWHDDANWRALIATVSAWVAMFSGAHLKVAALVAGPLADPEVRPERRLQLLHASARSAARRGRVDDYDAIMSEVDRLTDQLHHRPFESLLDTMRLEAARVAAARDLPGVRLRTERRMEDANLRGDPFEHLCLLYVLAHVEHMQGHHAAAAGIFQRAIDRLVGADAFNLLPITEVMLSISLSYLGEEKLARQALDRAGAAVARSPSEGQWIAPEVDRARAMLEMAAGRESAARERLLAAAATAGDDVLIASEALHVALLLGADAEACAAALGRLAADAQDDVILVWARHARAVADRDSRAQLAAAEMFEQLGLDLDAAQAAALAAAAFRREGLSDSAKRAGALAASCADRCPGVRVPALATRPEGPKLTAREREIAGLAARGLSNPDIADALFLSVRSVETYVLRVYRKLGAHNRTELARALGVRADERESTGPPA